MSGGKKFQASMEVSSIDGDAFFKTCIPSSLFEVKK